MSDKAKEALIAEANHARAVAQDVAMSGGYFYPIKGIIYFLAHRPLWQPLLARSMQTLTLGAGITSAMFFFTYLPQMTLMAFTSGPLAPISAALLVLSESAALTSFFSRSLVLQDALLDTFDGTLVARGEERLVAQGREINPSAASASASSTRTRHTTTTTTAASGFMSRLGKVLKRPTSGSVARFRPRLFLRSLLYLPLNFVPVVGTVLYVYVQGKKVGPGLHARYFQLKGWDSRRREEWVSLRRGGYTGLGIASFALEMVPLASIVFAFTNTVGAALWAADLERALK